MAERRREWFETTGEQMVSETAGGTAPCTPGKLFDATEVKLWYSVKSGLGSQSERDNGSDVRAVTG